MLFIEWNRCWTISHPLWGVWMRRNVFIPHSLLSSGTRPGSFGTLISCWSETSKRNGFSFRAVALPQNKWKISSPHFYFRHGRNTELFNPSAQLSFLFLVGFLCKNPSHPSKLTCGEKPSSQSQSSKDLNGSICEIWKRRCETPICPGLWT